MASLRSTRCPHATGSKISKSYGEKQVLRDVSFTVNAGERLALTGPNGSGKSTVLRILASVEAADGGRAALSPPSLRLGYLPQGYADRPGLTVESAIPELERQRALESDVARLARDLASVDDAEPSLTEAYGSSLEELATASETVEGEIEPLLHEWGLGAVNRERPVSSLSGGEQTRLGLARLLAGRPDALLLDEPTNHLDLDGIEELEAWLAGFKGALVLVTHDRALLASVPTATLELSAEDGGWRHFRGSYTEFLETKEREFEQRQAAYGRQQREERRMKEQVRRLKERAKRIEVKAARLHLGQGARNRNRAVRIARQAKVVERRFERLIASGEREERPERSWWRASACSRPSR